MHLLLNLCSDSFAGGDHEGTFSITCWTSPANSAESGPTPSLAANPSSRAVLLPQEQDTYSKGGCGPASPPPPLCGLSVFARLLLSPGSPFCARCLRDALGKRAVPLQGFCNPAARGCSFLQTEKGAAAVTVVATSVAGSHPCLGAFAHIAAPAQPFLALGCREFLWQGVQVVGPG